MKTDGLFCFRYRPDHSWLSFTAWPELNEAWWTWTAPA